MKTHRLAERHTDKALLLQIADGDQRAFADLFHFWQGRLFGYIGKIVKSREVQQQQLLSCSWLGVI